MEDEKKAYDIKVLMAMYKAKGLDILEETAIMLIEETCDWIAESALISKTPFDDVAAIVMPSLKKMAIAQADKIDGKVG